MAVRRTMKAAMTVLLGVAWAGPSFAESPGCFHFGYERGDLETDRSIALGRIDNLSPRVNFVKREVFRKGCPGADKACRDKTYLVPGDEVVIIGGRGDFVCASYTGKKGRVTEGWLPRAAVSIVSERLSVEPKDWLGTWQSSSEQTIVVEAGSAQGKLTIKGSAMWGSGDPGRVARGAVNVGELDGEAPPRGEYLSFGMGEDGPLAFDEADEADCKVQMRRLGPYLLAKDNGMCGGHNVTFTGVYRRQ